MKHCPSAPAWALWVGLVWLATSCTAPARFAEPVQTALAQTPMRRLETPSLVVFYPQHAAAAARRISARLETCRRALDALSPIASGPAQRKSLVVLPDVVVETEATAVQVDSFGMYPTATVAQSTTSTQGAEAGVSPDPSVLGCHQVVLDVLGRQQSGIPGWLRQVFGPLGSPHRGLGDWFRRGLAAYYESVFQSGGRLHSEHYTGSLAAGMADEGFSLGLLSEHHRSPSPGGAELVGAFFVQDLVQQYGAAKLWQLIEIQSRAISPVAGVGRRFERVYGTPLNDLAEQFARRFATRFPRRDRPLRQRRMRELGQQAQYAQALNGTEAVVSSGLDRPLRLRVYDPSGVQQLQRRLTQWGLGRELLAPRVAGLSGLSLTAEGRHIYFVSNEPGPTTLRAGLFHLDVEHDELHRIADDLHGSGGSVSPDGQHYYYCRRARDACHLAVYDLSTHRRRDLLNAAPGTYWLNPRVSPDNRRLLVWVVTQQSTRLAIVDAQLGQELLSVSTPPGNVWAGSWSSGQSVVYAASDGQRKQIFETHLKRNAHRRLTDAPYLASQPFASLSTVRFLNREGWHWTLDEAPLGGQFPDPAERLQFLPSVQAASEPRGTLEQPLSAENHLQVLGDEPYSGTEGLAGITSWLPAATQSSVGSLMAGSDYLGQHSWAAHGLWNFRDQWIGQTGLSYRNATMAPVLVGAQVHYERQRTVTPVASDTAHSSVPLESTDTSVQLHLRRRWYESVQLDVTASHWQTQLRVPSSLPNPLGRWLTPAANDSPGRHFRLTGLTVGLDHSSGEATPYSGPRLALQWGAHLGYFPGDLGSTDFDLGDLAASARLTVPLPFSRRHSLRVALRSRSLLGAPASAPLLRVGGARPSFEPFSGSSDSRSLSPPLQFSERLLGFEELSLLGQRAVLAEVSYRLPWILDAGQPSVWTYFPAVFARQLEFHGFANLASIHSTQAQTASAIGAALVLRSYLETIPIHSGLQVAKRQTQDRAWTLQWSLAGQWDR